MKRYSLKSILKFLKFFTASAGLLLVLYNLVRKKMEIPLSNNFDLQMNYIMSIFLIIIGFESYLGKNKTLGYFLIFCGLFIFIVVSLT